MTRIAPWLVLLSFVAGASFVGEAAMRHGTDADDHRGKDAARSDHVLYIETNNAATWQNAVLAYRRDPDDGSLTLSGVFHTGGTGYKDVDQRIGPYDTDQEVIASPDKRFLFAVNSGSDNISVFRINEDGRLRLVEDAPFASGGKQPASMTLVGHRLYVVNRGDGILPTAIAPIAVTGTPGATNYTGFRFDDEGELDPISGSTVVLADGSSPSQIVHSLDRHFLFGDNLLVPDSTVTPPGPFFPAARSFLDSLRITSSGGLSLDTRVTLPPPFNPAPLIQGLLIHPTSNLLYGGLVGFGQLGVWSYDASGHLSFVGLESDPKNLGGTPGLCWIAINPGEQYLYTASVAFDVVSVFSIKDPTKPERIQNLILGGPKAPLPLSQLEAFGLTTAPFNLELDPSGRFLYVLTDQTCKSPSVDPVNCPQGTALHVLRVATDGTLTEQPGSPLIIPPSLVPDHAKGMVVF